MTIQRYDFVASIEGAVPDPTGHWVEFADHDRTVAGLCEALKKAKETIHALHGPIAWDIYDRCSPEMKQINAALKEHAETKGK